MPNGPMIQSPSSVALASDVEDNHIDRPRSLGSVIA